VYLSPLNRNTTVDITEYMKRIVLVASSVVMLLAGCAKKEVVLSDDARQEEIVLSAYTGRQATKAASAYTEDMKVSAFFSDDQDLYFFNAAFSYDPASSCYSSSPAMYWPVDESNGNGLDLDFYAVSSTSGDYGIDTMTVNTMKFKGIPVMNLTGDDDIVAALVSGKSRGDAVSVGFNHKLTKVSVKMKGENPDLKYVVEEITISANSTAAYVFETDVVGTEFWTYHQKYADYDFEIENDTIPFGTTEYQEIGASGYGLMLIPEQDTTDNKILAGIKYSVYDTTAAGEDLKVFEYSGALNISESAKDYWLPNKSIVYTFDLPSGASSAITFKGKVTDWDSDTEISIKYVSSITVSPVSVPELSVGDNVTLTATVLPADASLSTVVWSSSDASIATVNPSTGVVTGVAPGTVTITATAQDGSGVTGTCEVTVEEAGDAFQFIRKLLSGSETIITIEDTTVVGECTEPIIIPAGKTLNLNGVVLKATGTSTCDAFFKLENGPDNSHITKLAIGYKSLSSSPYMILSSIYFNGTDNSTVFEISGSNEQVTHINQNSYTGSTITSGSSSRNFLRFNSGVSYTEKTGENSYFYSSNIATVIGSIAFGSLTTNAATIKMKMFECHTTLTSATQLTFDNFSEGNYTDRSIMLPDGSYFTFSKGMIFTSSDPQ